MNPKVKKAQLLLEKSKRKLQGSLHHYAKKAWHIIEPATPYIDGWHIGAICEHLQAVNDGQIKELLINMPPRHMKSLLVSVFFPTWVWTHSPGKKFLYSSYAQTLSTRDSVKCRRIIMHPWYQKYFGTDWQLTGDQNQKIRFDNTMQGYRIATSVGGTGTGEGGDIICVDDPHKVGDAKSETKRKTAVEWWKDEMSTRGNNKDAAFIVVMQRVHEEDLSAWAKDQGYEHLCLPAEYKGKQYHTCIGWKDPRTKPDELLWEERFDRAQINKLKKKLRNQVAGQLQQEPAPEEGNLIKIGWFKRYRKSELPTTFNEITQSWDLRFDDDPNKGSYVVGQVWGRKGADHYLLHQFRKRVGFVDTLKGFRRVTKLFKRGKRKLVEKKANGAALINSLKSEIPGIIAIPASVSKVLRLEGCSWIIESGNVYIPHEDDVPKDSKGISWVDEFIHEFKMFPNGANDDQVDATTQYLNKMAGKYKLKDFGVDSDKKRKATWGVS